MTAKIITVCHEHYLLSNSMWFTKLALQHTQAMVLYINAGKAPRHTPVSSITILAVISFDTE